MIYLRLISYFIIVNDVDFEGYYIFDGYGQVDWVSNWILMDGAAQDGIVLGTQNNVYAGSWSDAPLTSAYPYICEKNDQ